MKLVNQSIIIHKTGILYKHTKLWKSYYKTMEIVLNAAIIKRLCEKHSGKGFSGNNPGHGTIGVVKGSL